MTHSTDGPFPEILRCEHRVWESVMTRDSQTLAELFSDDYIEITLAAPHRVLKSDVVANSPLVDDVQSYTIDRPEFRELDTDVVLLSYHLTLDGWCRGQPLRPRERWASSIWKRSKMSESVSWQCAFFQQSPGTPPPLMAPDTPPPSRRHVTPMTDQHLAEVIVLWKSADGLVLTDSDNVTDLPGYLAANSQMSHVALDDGRVVGAALCGHDGRRGYLHHLVVAPELRGQGLGTALVDACLDRLRSEGIQQCNLFLVDGNADARRFWLANGWYEWPDIRLLSKRLDPKTNSS